ncbi:terminase gpA endonuclease subunit [Endozoicomonas montiporae]|uniref:terminase gpA endonuclease subunit n=1 Tax=Endozoicomonas montiporae TaxID=1027273 RepID=UPI000689CAEA|nr:terminase gpA endonuclease subunit [Endozoicomonas montiporae]
MDIRHQKLLNLAAKILEPPPRRASWAWADAKRVLPPGSPEPGRWNTNRAPWVKGITESVRDPLYSSVIAVMGAQMSKTDGVLLNSVGWRMDDDPGPVLYIGPTRKNVESISKDRFSKLIKSVPTLDEALAKGKKETINEKFINGQRIGFGWAGSATELASHPSRDVFIDERDRMGNDVGGEGDPVSLAEARISNYMDGNVTVVSTPTTGTVDVESDNNLDRWKVGGKDDIHSPIWKLWQEGTRHEWAWPCPHDKCHKYFIPRFKNLFIPDEATPQKALKKACLHCPHCGGDIQEESKEWMNNHGVFVAPGQTITGFSAGGVVIEQGEQEAVIGFGMYLSPEDGNPSATFWVSGLCSPWRSFGQRAKTYVAALRSGEPGRIQAAINTGFGELYSIAGDAPDWQLVAELRRNYAFGDVPSGVQMIVAGVDVQGDRLIYVVRGFGYNFTSWLIEHGEIWGDTEHEAVWEELATLLNTRYQGFPISRMLIDSGYKPGGKKAPVHMVYAFCRRFYGLAIPTKGRDTQDKPYKFTDLNEKGHSDKPGKLMLIHTDHFKSWVHSRMEWPVDHPGAWFLPHEATDDYCQQVTAEARMVTQSGKVVWMKLRTDNHYFDAEVLASAAAHLEQVHRLPKQGSETSLEPVSPPDPEQAEQPKPKPEKKPVPVAPEPEPEPEPEPARRVRRKRRRRGFVSECEL